MSIMSIDEFQIASDTPSEYHAYQRSISRVSRVSRHTFAYHARSISREYQTSIRRVSDEYHAYQTSISGVSDEYQTSIK